MKVGSAYGKSLKNLMLPKIKGICFAGLESDPPINGPTKRPTLPLNAKREKARAAAR